MKICKTCRAENYERNNFCSNCGGNEFVHQCRTCGAELESKYCPNCGTPAVMDIQWFPSSTPTEEVKRIWSRAKENISSQISAVSFHRWMDVLCPLIVRDGILFLEAPDESTKKVVMEQYFDFLRIAARKADESIIDIFLILPSQRRILSKLLWKTYS